MKRMNGRDLVHASELPAGHRLIATGAFDAACRRFLQQREVHRPDAAERNGSWGYRRDNHPRRSTSPARPTRAPTDEPLIKLIAEPMPEIESPINVPLVKLHCPRCHRETESEFDRTIDPSGCRRIHYPCPRCLARGARARVAYFNASGEPIERTEAA